MLLAPALLTQDPISNEIVNDLVSFVCLGSERACRGDQGRARCRRGGEKMSQSLGEDFDSSPVLMPHDEQPFVLLGLLGER